MDSSQRFPAFHSFSSLCRKLCVVFCAALACALPARAESLPEIQQLMRQGQYAQALDKIDGYLASRPKDAQGRFFKGLILTELKRPGEAIVLFTQLTEDYPELPEPYNNLAVLYAQQKQYDRARAALEMAIRTHPSYAIAYENLGDVYAKLASQAYDKALQLDTSNAAAQSKLAMIRDLVSTGRSQPTATVAVTPAAPQTTAVTPATPHVTSTTSTTATTAATTATTPHAAPPTATVTATTPPPSAPTPPPATPPAALPTQAAAQTATQPAAQPPATTQPPATAPSRAESAAAAREVARTVAAWAQDWSKQDVKAYLGYYAPAFKPPKGLSRKDWEAEREARIRRPSWIKVGISTPEIQVEGNRATARFQQNYQASNLKNKTAKTLTFTRAGNAWLILAEETN
jgi:tetratricopeptide (TPR) repeat protein